ncbi:hypothetical protein [Amycolatopsis sp. NPDC000740]|uniref:hypothetical protein n=1 Tax=Amycolatopsis sp. NPDC000740 TaxID=3154269 RepID=UPI003325412D
MQYVYGKHGRLNAAQVPNAAVGTPSGLSAARPVHFAVSAWKSASVACSVSARRTSADTSA